MLCFENANGLPTCKNGCKSDKVKKLRYLWSKLKTDVMPLAETQINPSMLQSKDSLHIALFCHQLETSTLSNNSNGLVEDNNVDQC